MAKTCPKFATGNGTSKTLNEKGLSPAMGAALMSLSTVVVAINASQLKVKQSGNN